MTAPGATTRRGFLGGAAAGVALPALVRAGDAGAAQPPVAPWQGTPKAVLRGRALAVSRRGDRVLVAHDRARSVALAGRSGRDGQVIALDGMPVDVAISADGRSGVVTTGFWDHPSLTILDLTRGAAGARVDAGPAPGRVVLSADGRRAVIAGGEQEGTLAVVDVAAARVVRRLQVGRIPRGLAVTPDGRTAWVALSADDHVVRVDLRRMRITRTIAVAPFPDRLALAPDGRELMLTHADPQSDHVSVVDLHDRRARRVFGGPRPAAVGYTAGGRRVVALGGADALALLNGRRRTRATGAAPRDLVVIGRRAWTVSDLTGDVTRVTL